MTRTDKALWGAVIGCSVLAVTAFMVLMALLGGTPTAPSYAHLSCDELRAKALDMSEVYPQDEDDLAIVRAINHAAQDKHCAYLYD